MKRDRRTAEGSGAERGLTMVEMLVVLVLVSLLGTLLIQGTGFFLGRYAAIDRIQRASSLAVLREHWFASTVAAMIPSRIETRRFVGNDRAFEGVTLQPLAAEAGRPVRVRWHIEAGRVLYTEQGSHTWVVHGLRDGPSAFQYADSAGAWRESWPQEGSWQLIPRMVRLLSSDGRVLWLGHFALYPEPVPNYREQF